MEKSFKTAKDYCEEKNKIKLENYLSFFPERTRKKLGVMCDQSGKSLIRYALASRSIDIVAYLTGEGFLGDDFRGLLHSCTTQGDIEALRIFVKYQPEQFTNDVIEELLLAATEPDVIHLLNSTNSFSNSNNHNNNNNSNNKPQFQQPKSNIISVPNENSSGVAQTNLTYFKTQPTIEPPYHQNYQNYQNSVDLSSSSSSLPLNASGYEKYKSHIEPNYQQTYNQTHEQTEIEREIEKEEYQPQPQYQQSNQRNKYNNYINNEYQDNTNLPSSYPGEVNTGKYGKYSHRSNNDNGEYFDQSYHSNNHIESDKMMSGYISSDGGGPSGKYANRSIKPESTFSKSSTSSTLASASLVASIATSPTGRYSRSYNHNSNESSSSEIDLSGSGKYKNQIANQSSQDFESQSIQKNKYQSHMGINNNSNDIILNNIDLKSSHNSYPSEPIHKYGYQNKSGVYDDLSRSHHVYNKNEIINNPDYDTSGYISNNGDPSGKYFQKSSSSSTTPTTITPYHQNYQNYQNSVDLSSSSSSLPLNASGYEKYKSHIEPNYQQTYNQTHEQTEIEREIEKEEYQPQPQYQQSNQRNKYNNYINNEYQDNTNLPSSYPGEVNTGKYGKYSHRSNNDTINQTIQQNLIQHNEFDKEINGYSSSEPIGTGKYASKAKEISSNIKSTNINTNNNNNNNMDNNNNNNNNNNINTNIQSIPPIISEAIPSIVPTDNNINTLNVIKNQPILSTQSNNSTITSLESVGNDSLQTQPLQTGKYSVIKSNTNDATNNNNNNNNNNVIKKESNIIENSSNIKSSLDVSKQSTFQASGKYAKSTENIPTSSISGSVNGVKSRIKAFEQQSKNSASATTTTSLTTTISSKSQNQFQFQNKKQLQQSQISPSKPTLSRTVSPNTNFLTQLNQDETDDDSNSQILIESKSKLSSRKSKNGSEKSPSNKKNSSPESVQKENDKKNSEESDNNFKLYHFYGDSSDAHTDDYNENKKTEKLSKKKSKNQLSSKLRDSISQIEDCDVKNKQKIQNVTQELEKIFSDSSTGNEKSKKSKVHTKANQLRVMTSNDSIDKKSQEINLNTNLNTNTKVSLLTTAEKKLTAVYFKMKSLGIPLPSITQKMALDGLPLELQEKLIIEMSDGLNKVDSFKKSDNQLLKLDLSNSINKQNSNGNNDNSNDLSHGNNVIDHLNDSNNDIGDDIRRNMKELTKTKLQKLHWKPLNTSNLTASSLWTRNNLPETLLIEPDADEIQQLEKLFGIQSPSAITATATTTIGNLNKKGNNSHNNKINQNHQNHLPKVLDIQRSTNISIGLVNFKDIGTMRCILNAICCLNDLNGKLTSDKLLNFSNMLPTLDELKLLQNLKNTNNKAEIFCKLVIEYYPHLPGKLQSFLTVKHYHDSFNKLYPKINLFISTFDKILQNQNLVIIMNKMLIIGNILNAGTNIGHAKGFSLQSLAKVITMKGNTIPTNINTTSGNNANNANTNSNNNNNNNNNKKITLIEYTINSLKEKGFNDILKIVEELKSIDDIYRINLHSLHTEINELLTEYNYLNEQLQISNDYLLFYYQNALESWESYRLKSSHYRIRENDLVNTPYGPGTVTEVKSNNILKIRPLKWYLIDEVCHNYYIQSSQCQVRSPFEIGESVITHHGPGIITEIRTIDNIAVIKPLTWTKSTFNLPLIYEPIVSLRPYDDSNDVQLSNESDIPKLTRKFICNLKQFLLLTKSKNEEMIKLKQELQKKSQEFLLYFGETESENQINELLEILKNFRTSLLPLYNEEQNRKKRENQILPPIHSIGVPKKNITIIKKSKQQQQQQQLEKVEKVEKVDDKNNSQSSNEKQVVAASSSTLTTSSKTTTTTTQLTKKIQTPEKLNHQNTQLETLVNKKTSSTPPKLTSTSSVSSPPLITTRIETTPNQNSPKKSFQFVNVLSSSDSDSDSDSDSSSSDTILTNSGLSSSNEIIEEDNDDNRNEEDDDDEFNYDLWLEEYSKDQKIINQSQKNILLNSSEKNKLTSSNNTTNNSSTSTSTSASASLSLSSSLLEISEDPHIAHLSHIKNYVNLLTENLNGINKSLEKELYSDGLTNDIHSFNNNDEMNEEYNSQNYDDIQILKNEIKDKYEGFSFAGDIDELLHRKEVFGQDSLTSIELEALEYYTLHFNELMKLKNSKSSTKSITKTIVETNRYEERQTITGLNLNTSINYSHPTILNRDNLRLPELSLFDVNKTVFNHNLYIPETPKIPEKFRDFSFANNIDDLLKRREIEGLDALTSYEIEALEYYDQQKMEYERKEKEKASKLFESNILKLSPLTHNYYDDIIYETNNSVKNINNFKEENLDNHNLSIRYQNNNNNNNFVGQDGTEEKSDREGEEEDEESIDPALLILKTAQDLINKTKNLLKQDDEYSNDDDNDDYDDNDNNNSNENYIKKKEAKEIMERIERERLEEVREIMQRLENEMISQSDVQKDLDLTIVQDNENNNENNNGIESAQFLLKEEQEENQNIIDTLDTNENNENKSESDIHSLLIDSLQSISNNTEFEDLGNIRNFVSMISKQIDSLTIEATSSPTPTPTPQPPLITTTITETEIVILEES